MKFTRDSNLTINFVRAYTAGQITVGEQTFVRHFILTPETIVEEWIIADCNLLTVADMQPVIELEPEIVLLGTGNQIRFPDTSVQHEFLSRNIGFEVMDTAAACRTFNVLAHEDRRVAAALMFF